jgi:hypothetical protein
MEFLVPACAEHNMPANAVEIPRSDLPGSLRGHYRNAAAGSFRRLNASETFYLLQVPNPSHDSRAVCAVAVGIGRPNENRLFMLFGAVTQMEPRVTAALGRDLNLNAHIAGGWILVEISLHAESRAQ